MDRELPLGDVLLLKALLNQSSGVLAVFSVSNHPADDVAAKDVEHHVEIEVVPLLWPQQLRYIPTPHLVGGGGKELGLGVVAVSCDRATLASFAVCLEKTIHRAL